jgi:hypothetical protein
MSQAFFNSDVVDTTVELAAVVCDVTIELQTV